MTAFCNVVQQQYYGVMGETVVICIKFLDDVACQRLASVSWSYSKN